MTPRAGIAPAVMDSRSLFTSRIPEDLSPPSLRLQSLCSLLPTPPHVCSQHSPTSSGWEEIPAQGSRLWDVPARQMGATRPKTLRIWGFPRALCDLRGKTGKLGARVSQDHPRKGETRELMGCVPCGKQSLEQGTCRVQKGKSK